MIIILLFYRSLKVNDRCSKHFHNDTNSCKNSFAIELKETHC